MPQLPADLPLRGDGRWIFDFKLYFEIIEKKKREKEEKRDRNEWRKDRREENWRRWRYKFRIDSPPAALAARLRPVQMEKPICC